MKDRADSFFAYVSSHNFSAAALLLACLIDEIATPDNGNVFALSIAEVAKKLKCSFSTASRAIQAHKKAGGLIELEKTGERGRKKYHVAFLSGKQSTLTDVKIDDGQERKQKYAFCKNCGYYSIVPEKEFCDCGKSFRIEISIPENIQFEDWGENFIEKKGDVFIVNY